MIAKGHDIPNVTLVGIVSADVGLGLPDFRAAERTFQLLTQAAGRAGRGSLPGIVLIQTINPDHYAVRLAAEQDYEGFYQKEIQFRQLMRYPPFAALANVLVRSPKQEDALRYERRAGPGARSPAGGREGAGTGGSPGAETEKRISVSAVAQGCRSQTVERDATRFAALRARTEVAGDGAGD